MRTRHSEIRKRHGYQFEIEVGQIGDVQFAGVAFAKALNAVDAFSSLSQQAPGISEKGAPLGGQSHLIFLAIEKPHAKFFFEVMDLAGKRRLRQTQLLTRFGEIQSVRDSDEITQMTQLHKDPYQVYASSENV